MSHNPRQPTLHDTKPHPHFTQFYHISHISHPPNTTPNTHPSTPHSTHFHHTHVLHTLHTSHFTPHSKYLRYPWHGCPHPWTPTPQPCSHVHSMLRCGGECPHTTGQDTVRVSHASTLHPSSFTFSIFSFLIPSSQPSTHPYHIQTHSHIHCAWCTSHNVRVLSKLRRVQHNYPCTILLPITLNPSHINSEAQTLMCISRVLQHRMDKHHNLPHLSMLTTIPHLHGCDAN